ncbi:hypothetical protein AVEN_145351-1 [Araneus ventricosus]|uniref:Uncharacterized protein n=1 Tax=Araneus ventricosus TaxID=182803 RepID=A0A4Y2GK89_ARAVE|nr:hypothetical protein AVEN_145351-1 [Araneus ventricosus]
MSFFRTVEYNLRRKRIRVPGNPWKKDFCEEWTEIPPTGLGEQQMDIRVKSQVETKVSKHDCGMMTEICNFCQALYWRNELNSSNKYTKCCHDGKVRLPNLAETPDPLKESMDNIVRNDQLDQLAYTEEF